MSEPHASPSQPRRSLGARAEAQRVCRRILTGSAKLKDISNSQRAEILICLDQTAEMLTRLTPIAADVERLLIEHEEKAVA